MKILRFAAVAALLMPVLSSCVRVNTELGRDLIDVSQQYKVYTATFPLTDIKMAAPDSLSGYSTTRMTIGAIRDDEFKLTSRGSAVTLVPALAPDDTLDFGVDPKIVRFSFHVATDTVSALSENQRYILQNVNVYELDAPLKTRRGTNDKPAIKAGRITKGVPVYNGKDSLSFDFTAAFGQKYIDAIKGLVNKDNVLDCPFEDYVAALPGIYIDMDPPAGNGGRINLFELSCLTAVSGSYTRNYNEAILRIRAKYPDAEGKLVEKDSSFLFIPGEPEFTKETDYTSNNKAFDQLAFNYTYHDSRSRMGAATDKIFVEGGGGLKPVISAKEMDEKVRAHILANGGSLDNVLINRATLELPFEAPADYSEYDYFPAVLSPTCRIDYGEYVQYASLTDASASSEDPGEIDRSNDLYRPDITHHLQEMLKVDPSDAKISNYDVWFLALHTEVVETASTSSLDNEYYQNLMYANYYNQLYGDYGYGGYGYGGYGYGGYGGYGYGYDSYSNYYSYMMLAQMYQNANTNNTTTTTELDKDRWYKAVLNGPTSTSSRKPVLKVTYSLPVGE